MSVISLTEWNQFLTAHPQAHLLQTGEWGELKSAFGWEAMRFLASDEGAGAQVLFRKLPLGLTIAYLPKGPVGRLPVRAWEQIDRLCRRRNAVLLKMEPDSWEGNLPHSSVRRQAHQDLDGPGGFHLSAHNFQPPRTLVVDLEGSEEEILARMKQKTRYNIRLAQRRGVQVRAWNDLEAFHRMLLATGMRDGFGVHSLEYYRRAYALFQPVGAAELLLAEREGQPLAALMVFARGQRSWYVYGASSDEGRQHMPTYLLQWEAMRWARGRGASEYDLWGVPDTDEDQLEGGFARRGDGLWGVYRFKRGFGGHLVRAAQALDRVYKPFWHLVIAWRLATREAS